MIPSIVLRDVLDEAVARGAMPAGSHDRARVVLDAARQAHLSWYLRVLTGAAAWVGALFLLATGLGIVAAIVGERVDGAAVLLGLALLPVGLRLRRAVRSELGRQAALVAIVAGQLLLVTGVGSLTNEMSVAALAALASSAVLVAIFDDPVYRFVGALAAMAAVLTIAIDWRVPYALGIVTGITGIATVVIWRGPAVIGRHLRTLDPVAWAAVVALCGLLLTQTLIDVVFGRATQPASLTSLLLPATWPLATLFVGLLVWLAAQVAREHGASPSSPTPAIAMAAAVILGALTLATPAVPGALLLVVVGYDRRRAGVIVLGGVFLVVFLGLHYYSLALTLLQKSMLLSVSGAVCLAAAWLVGRQGEEVSP